MSLANGIFHTVNHANVPQIDVIQILHSNNGFRIKLYGIFSNVGRSHPSIIPGFSIIQIKMMINAVLKHRKKVVTIA